MDKFSRRDLTTDERSHTAGASTKVTCYGRSLEVDDTTAAYSLGLGERDHARERKTSRGRPIPSRTSQEEVNIQKHISSGERGHLKDFSGGRDLPWTGRTPTEESLLAKTISRFSYRDSEERSNSYGTSRQGRETTSIKMNEYFKRSSSVWNPGSAAAIRPRWSGHSLIYIELLRVLTLIRK